jgi:hypothetical protein
MSGIEKRLARLEQAVSPRETVHVWQGEETADQVIALHFPEGEPPNGVTVILYRWANDRWADEDQAPADSRRGSG